MVDGLYEGGEGETQRHYGCDEIEGPLQNHLLRFGGDFFADLNDNRVRDVFGVVWDRSVDRDIGNVEGQLLAQPTLAGYQFPDPLDRRFFAGIDEKIARFPDRFRVYQIGFSLYERAWTLRGMEALTQVRDFGHKTFYFGLFGERKSLGGKARIVQRLCSEDLLHRLSS